MGKISWNFKDEVVVITGGGAGIGRDTCLEFAKAGAKVCVCDFNVAGAEETAKLCQEAGGIAKAYRMDVTSAEEVDAARDAILADFGTVDILFSNAGRGGKTYGPPLEGMPDEDWQLVFDVNVFGTVRVCRSFLPTFKEKKQGKIVITASIARYLPGPVTAHYAASKSAVYNFAQSLSMEMGPYNVNVNILSPGFVYTNIYADGSALMFREKLGGHLEKYDNNLDVMNAMASGSSLKRAQTGYDMAQAVMFLCTENAKEITGQSIIVDSGYVRR